MTFGPATTKGKKKISDFQKKRWQKYRKAKERYDWDDMARYLGEDRARKMKEKHDLLSKDDR